MKKFSLPSINKDVETVVLANGNFPNHHLAISYLNNCKHLIACDGATNKLVNTGRIPHIIVGDCDSLSEENRKRFSSIIHKVTEQETNDLTKAIHFCVKNGLNEITILGATGMREDHTIGNISLLCEYLPIANVEMITDFGIFIATERTAAFESYKGQQVSLFPLDKQVFSTKGLRYEIENKSFDRWWQATLNESTGNEFIVETAAPIIVFRAF